MALIALTAIACLCFVFHVCNGRTFTHSTAEALCPGSGVVIEADIADNTTSCEVLRDLQSGQVNVYKNHPHCFCIVASSPCDSVQLKWNGVTFPHGRKAQTARTVNKRLFLVKYCLRHEEASLSANGTEVYFELLNANNHVTVTSKAIINIVGSPIPPRNISVNSIDCNQGVLTWLSSPTARKYSITIECGETYITANETVYDTSYSYTYYDQSIRQQLCQVSIEAINPAGRGMSGVSMMLAKVTEPAEYFLSDIDIIMRESHAMVHFSITVDEECPQSRHVTACAGSDCVPVDASSSNDAVSSKLHGQLSLPQHKLLNMTVEICTDGAEEHCVFLTRQLSTHHVQSAGICGASGNCSLHCDYAQGHKIQGCVFKFIDHDDTSQHLAPVFVHNGNKVLYELGGEGTYSMLVFDWEKNQWRVWGPAVTRQITVTEKTTVDKENTKIGKIIGITGAVVVLLVILIGAVLITLLSIRYYNKRGSDQPVISLNMNDTLDDKK